MRCGSDPGSWWLFPFDQAVTGVRRSGSYRAEPNIARAGLAPAGCLHPRGARDRIFERTSTSPPITNLTHDHRQNRRKPTLRPFMTGKVANRRPVGQYKCLEKSARWRRSPFRASVRAGWGLLPAIWGSGTWAAENRSPISPQR